MRITNISVSWGAIQTIIECSGLSSLLHDLIEVKLFKEEVSLKFIHHLNVFIQSAELWGIFFHQIVALCLIFGDESAVKSHVSFADPSWLGYPHIVESHDRISRSGFSSQGLTAQWGLGALWWQVYRWYRLSWVGSYLFEEVQDILRVVILREYVFLCDSFVRFDLIIADFLKILVCQLLSVLSVTNNDT